MVASADVRQEQVAGWNFHFLPQQNIIMSAQEATQLLHKLQKWQKVFPGEENAAKRFFGVPSVLVRLDYVCLPGGKIGVYEIDDRPCGIGFGAQLHKTFWGLFSEYVALWEKVCGKITVLISERRRNTCDDAVWAQALGRPLVIGDVCLLTHKLLCIGFVPKTTKQKNILPLFPILLPRLLPRALSHMEFAWTCGKSFRSFCGAV